MEERFFKFKCFAILSKFPGIIHGVSTRNYGDMKFGRRPDAVQRTELCPEEGSAPAGKLTDEEIIKNRQQFFQELGVKMNEVVVARLAHGTKITNVGREEKGRGTTSLESAIQHTDGLVTTQKQVYLMVTVADCIPIFAYDPVVQAVGLFHAGWRGIIDQIGPKIMEKFKNLGAEPANLTLAIGPGICQKHFVVKDEVLTKFKEFYPSATFVRNHDGYVDLKKAILFDLKKEGVVKNNIEVASDCPFCQNGVYGSFRKEGNKAPASAAIIGMKQ
jgi:hypothetical protein